MATKKKPFLTTPAGSWVKVFVAILLAQILIGFADNNDFFSWDVAMIKKVASATIAGFIPMIVNALNPNYPLYGAQPKNDVVVDNPDKP